MKSDTPRRRSRWLALLAVPMIATLTSCEDGNTPASQGDPAAAGEVRPGPRDERSDTPVVLTGSQLAPLIGTPPGLIVAFALDQSQDGPVWRQIPVQVDERKVVPFGLERQRNSTTGVEGTVYGKGSGGPTALQYADPNTFVGTDGDAAFDSDDELTFMAVDGGGEIGDGEVTEPAGVVSGTGVQVRYDDPRREAAEPGWVYLYRSDGTLTPGARKDYVSYQFNLTSGDYKTTYNRVVGPNPETSLVSTSAYRIGLHDRWIQDDLQLVTGGTPSVDLLDGDKARFGLGTCARSNQTFREGEGAFVANIDGPVRAIRSYVGANSGQLTQRTHYFYRDRELEVTDLRVHRIPSLMNFLDFNTNAIGLTYASSLHPEGIAIDGAPDEVSSSLPAWELVTGSAGTMLIAEKLESSIISPGGSRDSAPRRFYRDELDSAIDQCWGDAHFVGAVGVSFESPIPNTDPREVPFETFRFSRTIRFLPPSPATLAQLGATAADWTADQSAPLEVTVSPV